MESGFSRSQKIACLSGLFLAWAVGYADRILMSVAVIPISHELALDTRQVIRLNCGIDHHYIKVGFAQ